MRFRKDSHQLRRTRYIYIYMRVARRLAAASQLQSDILWVHQVILVRSCCLSSWKGENYEASQQTTNAYVIITQTKRKRWPESRYYCRLDKGLKRTFWSWKASLLKEKENFLFIWAIFFPFLFFFFFFCRISPCHILPTKSAPVHGRVLFRFISITQLYFFFIQKEIFSNASLK